MTITKKVRQRLRSNNWPDMKPYIFDKLIKYLPHVLAGVAIPNG